jgi:hypothetical protein
MSGESSTTRILLHAGAPSCAREVSTSRTRQRHAPRGGLLDGVGEKVDENPRELFSVEEAGETPLPGPASASKGRVLVIEDDQASRYGLGRLLESEGIETSGVRRILTKPVNVGRLLAALREVRGEAP